MATDSSDARDGDARRWADLRAAVGVAVDALASGTSERGGPVPAATPVDLAAAWRGSAVLPEDGEGPEAVRALVHAFAAGAADPAHPAVAAHLHCPPVPEAVAADLAAGVLNQSLDSWDQAPSGTSLEPEVVATLAGLVGYDPATAGGVMTTGGTESVLMGLLLARDRAALHRWHADATRTGLPAQAYGRVRVLCSADAHFSVARNAGFLGLGEDAVLPVAVDGDHRMDVAALDEALAGVEARGEVAAAVVATAGTTDLGAIDPLPAVAALAARYGAWLHVDAAYGGGALFSEALRSSLDGVARADSVGLDLHKVGWLPVAAGVFLLRDVAAFGPLDRQVAYLNPADDADAGYPSLLGRSLRTTRRVDALKVAVTLRAYGRRGLGGYVDRCHALAAHAARRVAATPELQAYADPVLTTLAFRLAPARDEPPATTDARNAGARRALLAAGRAVVGRTTLDGQVWLKLTLLNPATTEADLDALLAAVVAAGTEASP